MPDLSKNSSAYLLAGSLYVLIILSGLFGEVALRAPLGAADTDVLLDSVSILQASILIDAIMITADIALAVILLTILASVGPVLAAMATAFRLIQAAILGAGLTALASTILWIQAGDAAVARVSLNLHAVGYDLGLIFFGVNSVLTGILLRRHAAFPHWLGAMVISAGGVYLAGSSLRILAPDAFIMFQPAYVIAIVAETAFAFALLARGLSKRPMVAPVSATAV